MNGTDKVDNGPGSEPSPVKSVEAVRISTSGGSPVVEECCLAVERETVIDVEGVGLFGLMCTPNDLIPLAAGFLFSEEMIDEKEDIVDRKLISGPPDRLRVSVRNPAGAKEGKKSVSITDARLRNPEHDTDLISGIPVVGDTLRLTEKDIRVCQEELSVRQDLFRKTGGTHAALVFPPDGGAPLVGEDISRHCAVDKAIGKAILDRRSPAGGRIALSGRVSFELVSKCARARIELIAAVSAPSSLAVAAADRAKITLCGFVLVERATVYTCRHRVTDLDAG